MNSDLEQQHTADGAVRQPGDWKTHMHFDDELFLKALIEAVKGTYASPDPFADDVPMQLSRQELPVPMSANPAFASSGPAASIGLS
jgi:hypothetical protein